MRTPAQAFLGRDFTPKLALRARLRIDRLTGAAFLLYPERGLRLNATAAEILRLCDGERTLADVARALSEGTGADGSECEREVDLFLSALYDKGLLQGARP